MKLLKSGHIYHVLLFVIIFSACSKENPASPAENDPENNETQLADIAAIDNLVTGLMNEYSIPGASLALSKDGKMVYSKHYGFADTGENVELTNGHSFRIASCSKTFTGAAIMKLIEEGELSFSDKIFGPESIFGNQFGSLQYSDKLLEITLEDLLHHTLGGWGVASGGDPIDYEPQRNDADFISYVLDNWDLTYAPGTEFVYSNMGYYLLARIIEEVSGKSYSAYLKEELLKALPLPSLHVTTFDIEDRQPDEVEYYGQGTDKQYIYTIADRRDGDAGIVITAEDLLKFVNAIDGFNTRPDVLSSETIDMFTKPTPVTSGYAAGISTWDAQKIWFHYGSLPGTRSAFMRHDNGKNIVLLFNSKPAGSGQYVFDIQDAMLEILNNNQIKFQDIDLFD